MCAVQNPQVSNKRSLYCKKIVNPNNSSDSVANLEIPMREHIRGPRLAIVERGSALFSQRLIQLSLDRGEDDEPRGLYRVSVSPNDFKNEENVAIEQPYPASTL